MTAHEQVIQKRKHVALRLRRWRERVRRLGKSLSAARAKVAKLEQAVRACDEWLRS